MLAGVVHTQYAAYDRFIWVHEWVPTSEPDELRAEEECPPWVEPGRERLVENRWKGDSEARLIAAEV